jgi:ribosomal protein S18 acetylase RimI-like enzyme
MVAIRKATSTDAKDIATHLLFAMEDIVYKFIGEENTEKANGFMLHFAARPNNQYSYENCWVAEVNNSVVAVIIVYDGARLVKLRGPVVEFTRSKFNPEFQPEDETQAGEYYIDCLAVNPDQQGRGIGTKLLEFVIDEYVNKQGQTLGLLVDEVNPNAKRLYLKLGFKSVATKVVFAKNMEHLQIKP